MPAKPLSRDSLHIDCEAEVESITNMIRKNLRTFKKRGIVLGLSGGIDSSVTAALCVKAIGAKRVYGLHMPEQDSDSDTLDLSRSISDFLEIDSSYEDITPTLQALGCYKRQETAIKLAIPDFTSEWKSKIAIQSSIKNEGFNYFEIVAQSPSGELFTERLSSEGYLGVVAATNFKQRVRKMMEYYYADKLNFAVAGTPNRLEYDQGFFVKLGDGAADIKPIAHLYKSQVYALAEYLGIPEQVRSRPPTTDTYSLPQSQDEFYFALPYAEMDLCLYAKNHGYPAEDVAPLIGLSSEKAELVYKDIDLKRSTTKYLHARPALAAEVAEV